MDKSNVMIFVILFYLGLSLLFVVNALLIYRAFKVKVWWGLACLCVQPAWLVFLIIYWQENRQLGYLTVVAALCFAAGFLGFTYLGP